MPKAIGSVPKYAYALAVIAALVFLLLPLAPATAAEGLVPCGNPGQPACNVCYFGELVNRVIRFGIFNLAIPVAILMLLYGGFRYAFSFGNPNNISAATKVLRNTLVGLFIVFAAFFAVDTAIKALVGGGDKFLKTFGPWNDPFKDKSFCEKFSVKSSTGTGAFGGAQGSSAPIASPETPKLPQLESGQINEEHARALAKAADINVNKTPCPPGVEYGAVPGGCTSLYGVKLSTMEGAQRLKESCKCYVLITGGTEVGHTLGDRSHSRGDKLDFALAPELNTYIKKTYKYIGYRADGAIQYQEAPGGTIFAKETSHWDVTFKPK